jgi:hypothetical protein
MFELSDVLYKMPMMSAVSSAVVEAVNQLKNDAGSDDPETSKQAKLILAYMAGVAMQKTL